MTLLIRLLFLVVILSLVRFVLFRLFARSRPVAAPPRTQMPPTVTGRMIKDPQCGTYVASELAVTGRSGGQTLYFCSPRCRDHYLQALAETGAARSTG